MDYKEKYKQALERAKEFVCKGNVEVAEYIFPELKESEDEEIRKALLEMVHDTTGDSLWVDYNIHKEDAIAWLEKQGEPVEMNPTEFDTRLQALIGKFDNLPKKELIGSLSFWMNVVQNDGTYKPDEKQGEHSIYNVPSREVILAIWDLGNEWKELTNGCISTEYGTQLDYIQKHWQESEYYLRAKQGEQKPADKVEPKFHEGEWVVSNRYTSKPFCITKVCDTYYLVDNDSFIPFEQESDWRLWTIQDAKDGDVLAGHESIVIFKEIDGLNIKCYCTYHFMNFTAFYLDTLQNKGSYFPATQEQRKRLFNGMENEGYKWDAEKKELKKIEQNPAWSEEDEKLINRIEGWLDTLCDYLKDSSSECVADVKDIIGRLKSLKPQKQWKPSDEQMKILNEVLNFAANHENPHWNDYIFGTLNNLIKQLKEQKGE